jgi:hypothetical protein
VLAQTPASPPRHSNAHTVNPVGSYEVSFVRNGEASTGVLTISGEHGGSLKGSLEAHGHTIPLPTVSVAGRDVTLRDSTDLSITLTIPETGALSGKWSGHGDSGSFTAVRRSH